MKKSELKEIIKAAFMAEGNYDEVEAAQKRAGDTTNSKFHQDLDKYKTSSNYGSTRVGEGEEDLDEMLARLSEEEVEEVVAEAEEKDLEADLEADIDTPEGDEEVDVEVDAEEEAPTKSDSIVIDKKIVSLSSLPGDTRKILDTLETLRAQAEEFGDQKFITQVGNTITFFTRDFVVAGDAPNPQGIEEDAASVVRAEEDSTLEEVSRWKKLAGIKIAEIETNPSKDPIAIQISKDLEDKQNQLKNVDTTRELINLIQAVVSGVEEEFLDSPQAKQAWRELYKMFVSKKAEKPSSEESSEEGAE